MTTTQKEPIVFTESFGEPDAQNLLAQVDLPDAQPKPIYGALIGTLAGIGPNGEPIVDFPGNRKGPTTAIASTGFEARDVGSGATLLFEGGDPLKPILMGIVREAGAPAEKPVTLELDGERLVFSAKKEIVLKCGKASITLTKAGKVLIRGSYLSNRSSGVNRIKGGSVQIN